MKTFDITFFAIDSTPIEDLSTQFYEHFDGMIGRVADRLTIQVLCSGNDGLSAVKSIVCKLEENLSVRVDGIDPDLVDIPEIASRVGKSRQAVQQWVAKGMQAGSFPVPIGSPGGKRIWSWAQINGWLREKRPMFADKEYQLSRDEFIESEHWLLERKGVHSSLMQLASASQLLFVAGASTQVEPLSSQISAMVTA